MGIDSFVGRYGAPGLVMDFDYGEYSGCVPGRGKKIRIPGASIASLEFSDHSDDPKNSLPYGVVLCARPDHRTPSGSRPHLVFMARCASEEKKRLAVEIFHTLIIHS